MTNLSGANLINRADVSPQGEGIDSPSTFPAYPAYKDSGAVWLGSIPEHWAVSKIGFRAKLQGGFAFSTDAFTTSGVPVVKMNNLKRGALDLSEAVYVDAESCDQRFSLQAGDILYGMSGSIGPTGSLGNYAVISASDVPAMLNQRVGRFVLNTGALCTDFLKYYLCSRQFNEQVLLQVTGTAQFNISSEQVESCFSAFPPRNEQTQIARFLDHETARIDALIENQLRLIELLKEKRQAVISHTVTKGLDPKAPMKDSGVEWLGEVPAHWSVLNFNLLVYIAEGQVDPKVLPYSELLLIAPNHVESATGRLLSRETAEEQGADSGKYLCKEGDVVYSKIRPALRKVCLAPIACLCSADMYPMRGHSGLQNEYLYWFILSEPFSAFALLESDRVAMPKINRESLGGLKMARPPANEQKTIAAYLSQKTQQIDTLIEEALSGVGLLSERRSALISAATTGRIDVRGWQPPASAPSPELTQEVM